MANTNTNERCTVQLTTGEYVSSPTDKLTRNPSFAAVFDNADQARAALTFHGGNGAIIPYVAKVWF